MAKDTKGTQTETPPNSTENGNGDQAARLKEMIGPTVRTLVQDALQETLMGDNQPEWMREFKSAMSSNQPTTHPAAIDDRFKGIGAARFVRALAFGQGDPNRAAFFSKKVWSDDLGDRVTKALEAGTFVSGGFMVPPEFLPELVELLRSRTIVRRAGPRILPMDSGTLTLRRQTAAASASYIGESTNIPTSQPTGGQIVMTAKKLAALVPISNDLLTFTSSPAADEFVRDDLIQVIALREDLAFIRDDGMENKPKGLRFWAPAANILITNGTSSTNIEDDFKDLINALEGKDVALIRPVWFMNPRSKNHLVNLRDGNGNLIYPAMRDKNPTMFGWPVFISTAIPVNLGGGGLESEVYFVDMNDAVIAEASDMAIAVDSSASYTEGSSTFSSFQRDETLIRAIQRHDFAMRHDVAVAVMTQVLWGS